jgi:hypothetical protein
MRPMTLPSGEGSWLLFRTWLSRLLSQTTANHSEPQAVERIPCVLHDAQDTGFDSKTGSVPLYV